ncbi:hypothetical protein [uncultured Paludibaculum sp.]|uniref:hypothetical protein n=1 Tax=uncultured Paludibaculum sp. TaxID=1765020 RepID=UPI002AAB67D1|nr:hypothetical protein [uncultured Paludibaculum sp.]
MTKRETLARLRQSIESGPIRLAADRVIAAGQAAREADAALWSADIDQHVQQEQDRVDLVPLVPGRYRARNGRVAVVVKTNDAMSDGYLEPRGRAGKSFTCWNTRTALSYSKFGTAWDIVGKADAS